MKACIPSLIALLLPLLAAGQYPPPACDSLPVYRALDFWVGEWDVYVDDKRVGSNRIEKILKGCAVLEHWTGSAGGQGKSLFYVDDSGTWQQVWVTEHAVVPGGVKEKTWRPMASDEAVRFQGTIARPDKSDYLDRTTLTPLPGGDVRQLIEVSFDDGSSWETTFDAVYRKREP